MGTSGSGTPPPRRSVILIDEPELHLNPSLLQGFTDFYHRHLGVAQENQLWLVTHSDTLLRQALGNSNYRVYHMLGPTTSTGNQASEVLLDDDLERVVVELVGDLAAYRPHAKVVILEGSGQDGFDEALVRRLFPKFARRVNLVRGGPKRRVRDLYRVLNDAASEAGISNRFFAIVDKDSDAYSPPEPGAQEFTWSAYHIENFLLEPEAIRSACFSLTGGDPFSSDDEVIEALRSQASDLIDSLILEQIRAEVNANLVGAIEVAGDPDGTDVAVDIRPSIEGSVNRVVERGEAYSAETLTECVAALRTEFNAAIDSDGWMTQFPGRRILRRFVNVHVPGVGYEAFRNVIVDKLALEEHRPLGMADVLDQILDA